MFQSGIGSNRIIPCSSFINVIGVKFHFFLLTVQKALSTDVITDKVTTILNQLILSVRTIATPLAVIGLIFCMIKIFTSPDEKTVRTAKQGALWILVAMAVIWLAEPIIDTIQTIAA